MLQKLTFRDRAEWLSWRRQDVTASTIGALYGAHEYLTPFALYALKTGALADDPEESPAMQRGRLLEPVAIDLLQERFPHWTISHPQLYCRDPQARFGATPDAFAYDEDRGIGTIQIKSVEPSIFRQKWRDAETGEITPPLWILLQSIAEAHLTESKWSAVAALVVGHGLDLHVVDVPVRPDVVADMRAAVAEFWSNVAAGIVPPMDFVRDADAINRIWNEDNGTEIDLSNAPRFNALVAEKETFSAQKNAAERELKAINAELLSIIGDAAVARFQGGRVTAKTIHRSAYTVDASSYRALRIVRDKIRN